VRLVRMRIVYSCLRHDFRRRVLSSRVRARFLARIGDRRTPRELTSQRATATR